MTLYAVVNDNQLKAVNTTTFTQEAILKRKYLQPMLCNGRVELYAVPRQAGKQKSANELES